MASTTTTIDNQINNYLSQLNIRQKKALLAVAKTFAEEHREEPYSEEFKSELDDRYEEYKSGGELMSEATVNRRIDKIIKAAKKK